MRYWKSGKRLRSGALKPERAATGGRNNKADMSEKNYYQSLARSMTLAVIVVCLIPLLISMLITGYYFNTSYKEKVLAHLEELVKNQQQAIDGFLQTQQAEIGVLAEFVPYERLRDESALGELLECAARGRPEEHLPTVSPGCDHDVDRGRGVADLCGDAHVVGGRVTGTASPSPHFL